MSQILQHWEITWQSQSRTNWPNIRVDTEAELIIRSSDRATKKIFVNQIILRPKSSLSITIGATVDCRRVRRLCQGLEIDGILLQLDKDSFGYDILDSIWSIYLCPTPQKIRHKIKEENELQTHSVCFFAEPVYFNTREDCKYFSGDMRLKCAVNPSISCFICADYVQRDSDPI